MGLVFQPANSFVRVDKDSIPNNLIISTIRSKTGSGNKEKVKEAPGQGQEWEFSLGNWSKLIEQERRHPALLPQAEGKCFL